MLQMAEHGDQPTTDFAVDRPAARRVGVIVLGMHRSGTSAMTRLLSLLGCALPSTLMTAAFHNPRGHWESQRIADFNDEVLALAGTQWNDWLPVNERLSETLVWPQLIAKGRQVLREEFADAPLFVLKDPRICKLAGFWMEVLAAENVDPAFVLPIRNPIEVARSLATRDAIDESRGLLFWLRHVLAAEAATRGRLRVFSDFAALLTNREAMATRLSEGLGVVWPRISALSSVEISEFLTPDLRHHVSDMAELGENPAISPWIRQAYDVLLDWARHGEKSSDYPVLDGISRAFDDAGAAFARPMLNGELAAQRAAQAESENTALAGERDQVSQRLGEVEAELARMIGSHNNLAEERDTTARRLGEVEAEFAQVSAERDARVAERDNLLGELAAVNDERNRLDRRLGEVEAELQQACAERDAQRAERNSLANEQAVLTEERNRSYALGLELEALQNRLADQESALRQKQEEAAQAWAELAAEREAVAALNERNDLLEQQAEALTRSLQDSESWVFQLAGERRQTEQRESRLTREVRQLSIEINSLKTEAERLKAAGAGAQREVERLRNALADQAAANTTTNEMELDLSEAQAVRLNEARQKERAEEIDTMSQLLQLAESRAIAAEAAAARSSELAAKYGDVDAQLHTLQAEQVKAEARLRERFGEVAMLTTMMRTQENEAARQKRHAGWLRELSAALIVRPWWWALMPKAWQRRRDGQRLHKRGLFDGDAYLAAHWDVRNSGMDPLRHYLLHGYAEGRLPTAARLVGEEAGQ